MKPKSALFLSAGLTAFVLVMTGSLVASFNATNLAQNTATTAPTEDVALVDMSGVQEVTATPTGPVTPEQAAAIAAAYLKKTDVYSVEITSLQGVSVYKVVFSSGDEVYVGLDGAVIPATMIATATPYFVDPTPEPQQHHNNGNGGGDDNDNHSHDDNEDEHENEHED